MNAQITKLTSELNNLSLGDALELRSALERRIASLALKSLSAAQIEAVDGASSLSAATSLAEKAAML